MRVGRFVLFCVLSPAFLRPSAAHRGILFSGTLYWDSAVAC